MSVVAVGVPAGGLRHLQLYFRALTHQNVLADGLMLIAGVWFLLLVLLGWESVQTCVEVGSQPPKQLLAQIATVYHFHRMV